MAAGVGNIVAADTLAAGGDDFVVADSWAAGVGNIKVADPLAAGGDSIEVADSIAASVDNVVDFSVVAAVVVAFQILRNASLFTNAESGALSLARPQMA